MRAFALLAVALTACGDAPATHGFSSGPVVLTLPSTGTVDGSTSDAAGTSTGTSSTGGAVAASTGDAPPPDMGTPPDFGPGQPEGCKGKIDLVFVISQFMHMELYQQQLLASFDGFMATIGEEFADFDTHIMVANPDDAWPGDECNSHMCPMYDHCGPGGEDWVCGTQPLNWQCDRKVGAGILFPSGRNATNHPCELAGGHRYITRDEPDLSAAFACVATVGTYGGSPKVGETLVEVVSPGLNGLDGCNAGFLREDALFVAVVISDVADHWSDSKDWPFEWYDDIVAAKGGDPDAIVMLSIIGPPAVDEPEPDCKYDYDPPLNRLYEFTEMFPHHVIGSVCADSYVPAFAATAALVKDACAGFIPQ